MLLIKQTHKTKGYREFANHNKMINHQHSDKMKSGLYDKIKVFIGPDQETTEAYFILQKDFKEEVSLKLFHE